MVQMIGVVIFTITTLVTPIELAEPAVAERGTGTPWHAHHIVERRGQLTIITMGEIVTGTVLTLQGIKGTEGQGIDWTGAVLVAISGRRDRVRFWWAYFIPNFGAVHRRRSCGRACTPRSWRSPSSSSASRCSSPRTASRSLSSSRSARSCRESWSSRSNSFSGAQHEAHVLESLGVEGTRSTAVAPTCRDVWARCSEWLRRIRARTPRRVPASTNRPTRAGRVTRLAGWRMWRRRSRAASRT